MAEEVTGEKSGFKELRQRVKTKITDKKSRIQKLGGDPSKTPGRFLIKEAAEDVRQENERARLEKLATTDPLTGLHNPRGYEERQAEEIARAIRNNYPLVVAHLDLNDLKTINDTLGHRKGDEYLIRAAEIIRDSVRKEDIAARIGGDEFRILFANTDLEQGNVWLERLRKMCEERKVNISVGLSSVDLTADIQHSIDIADARMYQDKREQKENSKNGK